MRGSSCQSCKHGYRGDDIDEFVYCPEAFLKVADLVAALGLAAAVGDVDHAGALMLAAILRGLARQVEGGALVAALVRAAPRVHALHVLQLVLPAVRPLPKQHVFLVSLSSSSTGGPIYSRETSFTMLNVFAMRGSLI